MALRQLPACSRGKPGPVVAVRKLENPMTLHKLEVACGAEALGVVATVADCSRDA